MTDKSGSPPCGIYIRIDDFSDMPKVITAIRQMALAINRASGYEKNMHVVELFHDGSDQAAERIRDLVPLIQHEGLIAIISGENIEQDIFKADGLLLDDIKAYDVRRTALGEDAILGLVCDGSKEKAQKALEKGADYIIVKADPSLISWWGGQTDILCVARGQKINNETCSVLALAGAGFIDATEYILTYGKGTMQATVNMMYALDLVAQTQKTVN